MRWELEALGLQAISRLPLARIRNAAQRAAVRRFGTVERLAADRFQRACWYVDTWQRHRHAAISDLTHYEIGAGPHLALALALWCLGMERQVVVDRARLARVELVNQAVAALEKLPADMARRPRRGIHSLEQFEELYGIAYRAPSDARSAELPDESVDLITSTLTLQHLPPAELRAVLTECRRVLKPQGMFMVMIDYTDHYAYSDPHVSAYNFLRFTESQWRWLNPPLRYQNRLRHAQFLRLFNECGFSVAEESLRSGSEGDLAAIRHLRLAPEFQDYEAEALAVRSARMALVKAEAGEMQT